MFFQRFLRPLSSSCRQEVSKRCLHATASCQKTILKAKLNALQKGGKFLTKTPKELQRLNEKKRLSMKRLHKKPYTKQQALHILQKKHNVSDSDMKDMDLGPQSDSDIKFLSLTKDKRLIYKILGVSGDQLRDSLLIDSTIKTFLKRNQVEKAIYLARLSKSRASAGFNSIIRYYLQEVGHAQSAIDIFNWGKKWGIEPNQYTLTILFDGLAKLKKPLSGPICDSVYKIAIKEMEKNELNQTKFNTALGALSNGVDVTKMFQLLEQDLNNVKRDAITYTYILRGSMKMESDTLFFDFLTEFLKKVPARFVDSKFLFMVCDALASRTPSSPLIHLAFPAINKYFETGIDKKSFLKNENFEQLPSLCDWNIDRKFGLNRHVLGLILKITLKTKQYLLGASIFAELCKTKPYLMDSAMFHAALELTAKAYPTESAAKCIELFNQMDEGTSVKPSNTSVILTYRAFVAQSRKGSVVYNEEEAEQLIKSCIDFMKKQDVVTMQNSGHKVLPSVALKFLLDIVTNCNKEQKVRTSTLNQILNEYLLSFKDDMFIMNAASKINRTSDRYVSLKIIRLIKELVDRHKIIDVKNIKNLTLQEKKAFTYRRLLLRLKAKLLDRLNYIEKGQTEKYTDQMNYSIKHLGSFILSGKELPDVEAPVK